MTLRWWGIVIGLLICAALIGLVCRGLLFPIPHSDVSPSGNRRSGYAYRESLFIGPWRWHGPFVERRPDGRKEEEGVYRHGKCIGRWIYYASDGVRPREVKEYSQEIGNDLLEETRYRRGVPRRKIVYEPVVNPPEQGPQLVTTYADDGTTIVNQVRYSGGSNKPPTIEVIIGSGPPLDESGYPIPPPMESPE